MAIFLRMMFPTGDGRWVLAIAFLMAGCGRIGFDGMDDGPLPDGGRLDAALRDAGERDAGVRDAGVPLPDAAPHDAGSGIPERVRFAGNDLFLLGGNLPWHDYGADFGDGNLASQRAELDVAFDRAESGNLRTVRWLMFGLDPSTPVPFERDGTNEIVGFTAGVLADLDEAIAIADAHDVYLSLVVFNDQPFPGLDLTNRETRTRIAAAIADLATRADPSGRVLSWSIWSGAAMDTFPGAKELVEAVALALAGSSSLFSVTVANAADAAWACDAGVDYVGIRPFDDSAFPTSAAWELSADLGITCPKVFDVVFLEPGGTAGPMIDEIYGRGFAGAFPWSLDPDKTADLIAIDLPAMAAFAARTPEVGP